MKNLAILIGVPVALWGAVLYPAWLYWGEAAIWQSGVALGLCLIPAVVTFLAIGWYTKTADERLLGTLAASGVRMGVCLGVGMLLNTKFGDLFPSVFMYWLVVFYLLVLALEVGLLVRQTPPGPDKVSS